MAGARGEQGESHVGSGNRSMWVGAARPRNTDTYARGSCPTRPATGPRMPAPAPSHPQPACQPAISVPVQAQGLVAPANAKEEEISRSAAARAPSHRFIFMRLQSISSALPAPANPLLQRWAASLCSQPAAGLAQSHGVQWGWYSSPYCPHGPRPAAPMPPAESVPPPPPHGRASATISPQLVSSVSRSPLLSPWPLTWGARHVEGWTAALCEQGDRDGVS